MWVWVWCGGLNVGESLGEREKGGSLCVCCVLCEVESVKGNRETGVERDLWRMDGWVNLVVVVAWNRWVGSEV